MHGAAMTHLIFAKNDAVAVELFSARLVAERSFDKLWFFARFTRHYGQVVLRAGPLRSRRSIVGNDEAERTVRCVAEVSVGGRAPSCGSAPRRGVHFVVVLVALLLFVLLRRSRLGGAVRWRVLDALRRPPSTARRRSRI
jgi:hypothetical protein